MERGCEQCLECRVLTEKGIIISTWSVDSSAYVFCLIYLRYIFHTLKLLISSLVPSCLPSMEENAAEPVPSFEARSSPTLSLEPVVPPLASPSSIVVEPTVSASELRQSTDGATSPDSIESRLLQEPQSDTAVMASSSALVSALSSDLSIPQRRESIKASAASQMADNNRIVARERGLHLLPPASVICYGCGAPIALKVLASHHGACLAELDRFLRELHRHPLCGLLAFPRPPNGLTPTSADADEDRLLAYSLEAIKIFESTLGGCKGCSAMYPVRDLPAHFVDCPRRFFTTSKPCPIEVRLPCHDLQAVLSPSQRAPASAGALLKSPSPRASQVSPGSTAKQLTPYSRRAMLYPSPASPSTFTVSRSPVFRSQQRCEDLARCPVCNNEVPTREAREDEEIRIGKQKLAEHRRIEAIKKIGRDRRRLQDHKRLHPPVIMDQDEDADSVAFSFGGGGQSKPLSSSSSIHFTEEAHLEDQTAEGPLSSDSAAPDAVEAPEVSSGAAEPFFPPPLLCTATVTSAAPLTSGESPEVSPVSIEYREE
jgi:hypothetical protein